MREEKLRTIWRQGLPVVDLEKLKGPKTRGMSYGRRSGTKKNLKEVHRTRGSLPADHRTVISSLLGVGLHNFTCRSNKDSHGKQKGHSGLAKG